MKASIKSILASLMLISLTMQSSMAVALEDNLKPILALSQPQASPSPTPIKKTCLNPDTLHALANREKDCQKCQLDLKTMTDAYNTQNQKLQQPTTFIEKPAVVAGGTAAVIILSCLLLHCQF